MKADFVAALWKLVHWADVADRFAAASQLTIS